MRFHRENAILLAVGASHILANELTDVIAASVIYFSPLIQYVATFGPILQNHGPNKFEKQFTLSSAANQVVQIANVDTVYMRAVIDLSEHDLICTIPEVEPQRGVVYPFHDIYGNDFANLGSYANASAGKYLLRLAREGDPPLQLLDAGDTYTGIVNFPTPYGAMFPRILVFNQSGDPQETAEIRHIEDSLTLEPQERAGGCSPQYPPLSVQLLQNNILAKTGPIPVQQTNEGNITLLLDLAAKIAPYNMPVGNPDNGEVLANLTSAGATLGQGWEKPESFNITAIQSSMNATLQAARVAPSTYKPIAGNAWTAFNDSILGNFHREYDVRAFIGGGLGYLAITTDMNWPLNPVGNPLTIGADECIIFTFEKKPPLQTGGFWSLTAYGADRYLIPNDLNRYSAGDRTGLTFSDGTLVYGGEDEDRDGTFQVLLQPADVPPPANWTSNWLPAMAGGGPVYLALRYYGPTVGLTAYGSYVFPADLKPRPAIRA